MQSMSCSPQRVPMPLLFVGATPHILCLPGPTLPPVGLQLLACSQHSEVSMHVWRGRVDWSSLRLAIGALLGDCLRDSLAFQLAKEYGMDFYETSACTNFNIKEVRAQQCSEMGGQAGFFPCHQTGKPWKRAQSWWLPLLSPDWILS